MLHQCDFDADYGIYFCDADYCFLATKRNRKCPSCGKVLHVGDEVVRYKRVKCINPEESPIEYKIHGEERPLSDIYLCIECGEIAMNLHEYGYCFDLHDNMQELLKEYRQEQEKNNANI